jgi:hypothetical protein
LFGDVSAGIPPHVVFEVTGKALTYHAIAASGFIELRCRWWNPGAGRALSCARGAALPIEKHAAASPAAIDNPFIGIVYFFNSS